MTTGQRMVSGASFHDGLVLLSRDHIVSVRCGKYAIKERCALVRSLSRIPERDSQLSVLALLVLCFLLMWKVTIPLLGLAIFAPKMVPLVWLVQLLFYCVLFRRDSIAPCWHGAEHKVIAAYRRDGVSGLYLDSVRQCSRLSQSCGIEVLAVLLPPCLAMAVGGGWFALLVGLLTVDFKFKCRQFFSQRLQQCWATREPTDEQLSVAINAMTALCQADEWGTETGQKFLDQLQEPA